MQPSIAASGNGAERRSAGLRKMTADHLFGLGSRQVVNLRTQVTAKGSAPAIPAQPSQGGML